VQSGMLHKKKRFFVVRKETKNGMINPESFVKPKAETQVILNQSIDLLRVFHSEFKSQ
jgi:hypothetical protein